jgi:hypothetical protein
MIACMSESKMMKRLLIKPLYGYGWEENGKRIDVPEPFVVDAEKIDGASAEKPSCVMGTIIGSHKFAGKIARLDMRTSGLPSHYNVSIYEKSSLFDAQVAPIATGFAELL